MFAQDIAPSRLIRSKMAIKSILDKLTGDRVSLVTFAGTAVRNSPLTKDYSSLEMFLEEVDPGQLPYQGTNINSAVELAVGTLKNTSEDARVMIFLSDGENHKESLSASVKLLKENKIKSIIISVGSKEGAPVPETDRNSGSGKFKKDNSGNIVLSKANRSLLSEFSKKVDGLFITGNNFDQELASGLESVLSDSRNNIGNVSKKVPEEIYYYFLILGGFFLLVSNTMAKKSFGTLVLVFLVSREGHAFYKSKVSDLYESEKYSEGESYLRGKINNGEDYFFELGNFYYRQQKYELAEKSFLKSKRQKSSYNAGNAAFQQGNFKSAIKHYEKFLGEMPTDEDAKHNLELAKKMQNQKSQNQSSDKESQKDQDKKNQDQQKQSGEQNKQERQEGEQNKNQEKKDQSKQGKENKSSQQSEQSEKQEGVSSEMKDQDKKNAKSQGKQSKESKNNNQQKEESMASESQKESDKDKKDKQKMSYRSKRLLNQVQDGRKKYQKMKNQQENRGRGAYNGIDW